MTTLSTARHQTRRGRPAARLAVLAELPGEWAELARTLMTTAPLPDEPFAYLLWQTFIGAGFHLAGPDARLRREGDARGRDVHDVDGPGRGVRGRSARARRSAPTRTPQCMSRWLPSSSG